MRIAVVGPGRMGQVVAALARENGDDVVAMVGPGSLDQEALANAQVAIEFTEPMAAPDNLVALAETGTPTVCGTTGWYDQLPRVRAAVEEKGTALLYAPNFALGVHLMLRLVQAGAKLLARRPEFDAYLVETHHREKKDAPSGTAQAFRDALRSLDQTRPYPITSIRAGDVPGTHALHLEAAAESITIEHAARDRTVFGRGALVAAHWLVAQPRRGVFTMDDVLSGD